MDGPFPDRIPALAHDMPPDFRHLSGSASRHNFKQACRKANIGVALPAYVEKPLVRTALGPTIFQQQKDFQDAVQPDSPISKLLQCVAFVRIGQNADNLVPQSSLWFGRLLLSGSLDYCASFRQLELNLQCRQFANLPLVTAMPRLDHRDENQWIQLARTRKKKNTRMSQLGREWRINVGRS